MRKYAGLSDLVAKHIDVTELQLSIILEVGKLNASLPDKMCVEPKCINLHLDAVDFRKSIDDLIALVGG
ncbi:hypothetical protein [Pseudoalteromonas sp.]|uniref:hypothetical protein n=1 Tax=unclassified Pseudoalteromonas TaxID=194690 RepID=UPI00262EA8D3|nr:hypothetical protein [Pseudoalteromonas sp.]MCP4588329.1 transposase [Pseudoalteromonas sp.]